MKKAQVSFEYLIIMGFVTFVIIGVLGVSFLYSAGIKDRLKVIQIENFGNKITTSAETVFHSGEPSKITISTYLPENVEKVEIIENNVVITFELSSGKSKVAFSSKVPIQGTISSYSGIKNLKIEAFADRAQISELS